MLRLPDRGSKRQRDEEDATFGDLGRKKSRGNLFAQVPQPGDSSSSSIMSSYQRQPRFPAGLPALTPAQSDDSSSGSPEPPLEMPPPAADTEMQDSFEDDFQLPRQPSSPANPFLHPPRLAAPVQHDPSNGRLPTPTYSSLQSRCGSRSSRDMTTMELDTSSTHRARSRDDRLRRVPSPISEDDSAKTPTSRLSRLSFTADESMDVDDDAPMPDEPHVSPRTGRARSGAIMGKKKFVMGFQPHCRLCRERVPGHNAHFLPM